MSVWRYGRLTSEQIVNDGTESKSEANSVWQRMWVGRFWRLGFPAPRGARRRLQFITDGRNRMQRWRLIEHGGNDLFNGNSTQSETPCQSEILFLHSGVFILVMGVSMPSRSRFQLIDALALTRDLVFFVVLLWPFPELKMG